MRTLIKWRGPLLFWALLYSLFLPMLLGAAPATKATCDWESAAPITDPAWKKTKPVRVRKIDFNFVKANAHYALVDAGYTDVHEIGSGGMGTLYRVKDPSGQWKVVKFLHTNEEKFVQALHLEVDIMKTLEKTHPEFHGARDLGLLSARQDYMPAFEMDFIPIRPGSTEPAPTLDSMLKDPKHLKEWADWGPMIRLQYARLISKAHEMGIAHLDLKPGNLLVSFDSNGDPIVHVIDWGLAHGVQNNQFNNPVGTSGSAAGTPTYIPPYRFRGEKPRLFDDVYASRIIDWELRNATSESPLSMLERYLYPGFPNPKTIKFNEPPHALDEKGSTRERMVAMAEWSLIPQNMPAREKLIRDAGTMDPESFFRQQGRALLQMPDMTINEGLRREATLEILGSSLLIDKLDTQTGLRISKQDIDAIARTAARFYQQSRKTNDSPMQLDFFAPHGQYFYERFGKRIDELARKGVTQSWQHWLDISTAETISK